MRMEFYAPSGKQHYLHPALLALGKHGANDLILPAIAAGILHLERAAAAHLDAIPQKRAPRQSVGAEAGAGIIHLQELDCAAGAVFYRCFYVVRVAGG